MIPDLLLGTLLLAAQFPQSTAGELRLLVTDASGLPLQAAVQIVSQVNDVRQRMDTDAAGMLVARRLPFGRYVVEVTRDGFASSSGLVDIQSVLPFEYRVTLNLAPLQAQVSVTADQTLIDTGQHGSVSRIGARTIETRVLSLQGRSLPALVDMQPGWLLEANGILHPRGSEYQTQYVVDGLPLTDNRSPSFAPEIDADSVHAMNVLTSGFPAEYGRKLGGVIEITTAANARRGLHGSAVGSGGSFATFGGFGEAQYGWSRTDLGVSGSAFRTDRYLDPPVEENFSNHGTGSNVAVHLEQSFGDADRLGAIVRQSGSDFLVPNELIQHDAGQVQRRSSAETMAQASYQHVFSDRLLGDGRAMVRNLSAGLVSNAPSTPIAANQDRGLREIYVRGAATLHAGPHELRAGFDAVAGDVTERFDYLITNPGAFDPGTPRVFAFRGTGDDREQAAFIQDRIRLGSWTINAGLRWDRYALVVHDTAVSPRLGVAWSWTGHDLVLRAAYDRAFQLPAVENLLLASSPDLDVLSDQVVRLPVEPSRGNFYDAGLSKGLWKRMRLDISRYRRSMDNFADDDLLLNTGVSFPIAFERATIDGTEVRLDMPQVGRLSGSLSYSNMVGFGFLPITGGLLIGDDTAGVLESTDRFPVTQDQRNTVGARAVWQLSGRHWAAASWSYGSGLPFEFTGDESEARDQYGTRIVERVDFARQRVRPSASLDLSASATIVAGGNRSLRVQADFINVTNRLNLINFAGVFSGTALGPPRSVAVRVQAEF